MPIQILVPELGESVVEATVGKWKKGVGDTVTRDEPIGELETDKITQELTAFKAGEIAALFAIEGDVVKVGSTIGVISLKGERLTQKEAQVWAGKEEEDPPKEEGEGKKEKARPTTKKRERKGRDPSAPTKGGRVLSSPAARKRATEMGVEIRLIRGSGSKGRVMLSDVEKSVGGGETERPNETYREKMTNPVKAMAKHMVSSVATSPHFHIVDEADISGTLAIYNRLKKKNEKEGIRLTLMPFFVRAAAKALQEFPRLNASVEGDEIVFHGGRDIGMAASVGGDLIVPVVKDADHYDLLGLSQEINRLSHRAREGKLTLDEITGGTFTITNAGMFGGPLFSSPIINQPQVAILGIHTIKERAVVVGGRIEARPMVYLSLASDHRIVDGVRAVNFLIRVKEILEQPGFLATGPLR
ncbi:2-oxo acid dehydrogenase subunit E2 [bacterium]|nr:2-oxo acid dehydrogenase subunit E2 [bacterium]